MLDSFAGKKVTVMGLGLNGGGLAAVRFLIRERAKEIIVTDLHPAERLKPTLTQIPGNPAMRYRLGGHDRKDFENRDFILKNPGVPWESPFLKHAEKMGIPIISDVNIFFARLKKPAIGVTGTKGKSTTTALITHILKNKFKIFASGNVRWKSLLEMIHSANRADFVVLELSSFQLEDLEKIKTSPHIAVITSIAPDHLNRHGTLANYKRIKGLIAKFQEKGDLLFIPADPAVASLISKAKSTVYRVGISGAMRQKLVKVNSYLEGHMAQAAALAAAVAGKLGVKRKEIYRALKSFKPLEGRRERVRVLNGVTFVNDTTATIPRAAAADLAHFAKKGRVTLIAGGMDKNLPFAEFARAIEKRAFKTILLPGSASDKIYAAVSRKARARITRADLLATAVRQAYQNARPGDCVLLAPGAASFNLFLHEFDRGEQFVKIVKGLKK